MRRREFIAGLAGAAAWPLASLAQQPDRVRRVGALITLAEGDPEARAWTSSLTRRLGELGWAAGRNIHIDVRWDAGDAKQAQMHAAEMVALAPEVILADGTRAVAALQRASPTIPVVFVQVPDPVGAGVLPSLSRPGGNLTGFTHYEYSTAGKWLELLKIIAPHLERVLVLMRESVQATLALSAVSAVAQSVGVQITNSNVGNAVEIERAVDAVSQQAKTSLLALPTVVNSTHRDLIVGLAARHRMPASVSTPFTNSDRLLSTSIASFEALSRPISRCSSPTSSSL
jgi:ABC-type uncharacterized transport system substrate-binding protein